MQSGWCELSSLVWIQHPHLTPPSPFCWPFVLFLNGVSYLAQSTKGHQKCLKQRSVTIITPFNTVLLFTALTKSRNSNVMSRLSIYCSCWIKVWVCLKLDSHWHRCWQAVCGYCRSDAWLQNKHPIIMNLDKRFSILLNFFCITGLRHHGAGAEIFEE